MGACWVAKGHAKSQRDLIVGPLSATGVLSTRNRQVVTDTLDVTAVPHLQAPGAARTVPVGGFTGTDKQRALSAKRLTNVQVNTALLATEAVSLSAAGCVALLIHMLAKGAVTLCGVAIANHGEGGIGLVQGFGIQKSQALTLRLCALPWARPTVGHVHRHATYWRIKAQPHVNGLIPVRVQHTAVSGEVVGGAIHPGRLNQLG